MYRPQAGRQFEYPPQQGYSNPPEHSNGPQQVQASGYPQARGQQFANSGSPFSQGQQGQQQQQQQPGPQYHPPQQQQQQQQQGQGGQQQQGGGPNGSTAGDAQSQANSGPAGQEMNLASVLHYLQSEWRRWERDRNEWEIERAEMRARIALLEGQRRSAENLKVDLLRRVKMLEYALRQERTKTVSTVSKGAIAAPSRLSTLQDEDKREDKEGSGSEGGSDEGSQDRPKTNGIHPAAVNSSLNMNTMASRSSDSPWKSIGTASKDPKARARSREYLKQCLQEITYLTSPGALNPLPARPPVVFEIDPSSSSSLPHEANQARAADRPRKTLPENAGPSLFAREGEQGQKANVPNGDQADASSSSSAPAPPPPSVPATAPLSDTTSTPAPAPSLPKEDRSLSVPQLDVDPSAPPPSSPARTIVGLPLDDSEPPLPPPSSSPGPAEGEEKQILTAIYRPESKAAWREELRAANEQAEKAKRTRSASVSSSTTSESGQPSDEEQLQSLTLNVEEVEERGEEVEKTWTSRKVLKSHLDVVRAVAFAQGPGVMLASAGDDCTVKVWYMEAGAVMSPKPNSAEIEPIMTYRTHSAPITSLTISSPLSTIFSASLDSTILACRLPLPSSDPYAPHDPANLLQVLEGHTDAVWDLCLVPSRSSSLSSGAGNSANDTVKGNKASPQVQKSLLVSASADGTVKVWEHTRHWTLKRSVSFEEGMSPTCLAAYAVEAGKVLVGFVDGRVGLVDVEEGGEVVYYGEAAEGGARQVNSVLCHPTWPVVMAGFEDGYIRMYHANTPSATPAHEILAHPAAVTSIVISPLHPHSLLSSASDCSIRVWDLAKRTSVQDCPGHRQRAGEGVVGLARHPELPVVASAGADGVVRVWSAA